tara:strand:- start:288 stop:554 length:267 start_codon:yes stop_codon:yes gene_type:complete
MRHEAKHLSLNKIKVMTEYLYEEQQKNERFEGLVNNKEVLTKEEVDFVISWDPTEKENMFYLNENEFLNLNVYSEHDHEKRGFQMETY